jgi:hypothetical protein
VEKVDFNVVYRMPCRERLFACAHDGESLIEYVNNTTYYSIRIVTKFIFSTENDLPRTRHGQCLGSINFNRIGPLPLGHPGSFKQNK